MFHEGLDEFVVCWLYKPVVLLENVNDSATTFNSVSHNAAGQSNVIRSEHKYFEVHQLAELLVVDAI